MERFIYDWLGVSLAAAGVLFDISHHYAGGSLNKQRDHPNVDAFFRVLCFILIIFSFGMMGFAIISKSSWHALFFFLCIPAILYLLRLFIPQARQAVIPPWATKHGLENTMFLIVNSLAILGGVDKLAAPDAPMLLEQ